MLLENRTGCNLLLPSELGSSTSQLLSNGMLILCTQLYLNLFWFDHCKMLCATILERREWLLQKGNVEEFFFFIFA